MVVVTMRIFGFPDMVFLGFPLSSFCAPRSSSRLSGRSSRRCYCCSVALLSSSSSSLRSLSCVARSGGLPACLVKNDNNRYYIAVISTSAALVACCNFNAVRRNIFLKGSSQTCRFTDDPAGRHNNICTVCRTKFAACCGELRL